MKAIVFDGQLRYTGVYPKPKPKQNEALIRISMAGICNTDIEIIKGYMGFRGIIGHEFVGVVEKIDGNDQRLLEKRVVGDINCSCGICSYCLKGMKTHCPERKTLGISNKDGAFAEYITLPVKNLFEVPENIADESAVFTEPLAAAFEISEQVHVKPTDSILVLGDGKLGVLCAFALRLTQADVVLAGKHKAKIAVAKRQGLNTVEVTELSSFFKTYDIVVEATGAPDGLELAMQLVKPGGKIVLKTTAASGKEINLAPVVINEIQIIGSRCGTFEPALRGISSGLIDVGPLVTAIYKPEQAEKAFERAGDGDSLKVLFDFRLSAHNETLLQQPMNTP